MLDREVLQPRGESTRLHARATPIPRSFTAAARTAASRSGTLSPTRFTIARSRSISTAARATAASSWRAPWTRSWRGAWDQRFFGFARRPRHGALPVREYGCTQDVRPAAIVVARGYHGRLRHLAPVKSWRSVTFRPDFIRRATTPISRRRGAPSIRHPSVHDPDGLRAQGENVDATTVPVSAGRAPSWAGIMLSAAFRGTVQWAWGRAVGRQIYAREWQMSVTAGNPRSPKRED